MYEIRVESDLFISIAILIFSFFNVLSLFFRFYEIRVSIFINYLQYVTRYFHLAVNQIYIAQFLFFF